jgi:hypothetical protein
MKQKVLTIAEWLIAIALIAIAILYWSDLADRL